MQIKNIKYDQKRKLILDDMQKIGLRENQQITKRDLEKQLQILNNNNPYDEDILNELFEKADQLKSGLISVSDFVQVLLEAETTLNDKIETTVEDIKHDTIKLEEMKAKIREHQQKEQYNNEGIALDSVLNVDVYQVQIANQQAYQNAQIFVMIETNGQQQRTQSVDMNLQQQNESFQFRIQTKNDSVYLKVMKEDQYATNGLGQEIAFQNIALKLLEDQYRKDEWLDLKNTNDGKIGNVRLRVALHFIHNKVSLLKEHLTDLNNHIQTLQNDVSENQTILHHLFSPFKSLLSHSSNVRDNDQYNNNTNNNNNQFDWFNSNVINNNNVDFNAQRPSDLKSYFAKDYSFNLKVMCLILMFLLILVSFARSVYLDLMIIFFFYNLFYQCNVNANYLNYVFYAFIFSFAVDFIWLICFANSWWIQTNYNQAVIGMRRTVVFFSFIVFFLKFGLMYIYLQFNTLYKQKIAQNGENQNNLNYNNQNNILNKMPY